MSAGGPADRGRAGTAKRPPRAIIPAQAGIQRSELRVHPPARAIIALRSMREGEGPSAQSEVGLIGTDLKNFPPSDETLRRQAARE